MILFEPKMNLYEFFIDKFYALQFFMLFDKETLANYPDIIHVKRKI